MKLDCVLVGFHDEPMENIIKRVVSKKESSASYEHYLARSIDCYGKRLKFSEAFNEAISVSTGITSDLTIYRIPNLALHYLRKYLTERDISVGLVNYFNDGKDKLVSLIKEGHPLVVGISSTCQVESDPLREIVDLVKKTDKNCVTVIGGPLINSLNFEYNGLQQDFMYRLLGADIFVHERQGQKALYEIILSIKNKEGLNHVNNIIYKDGGNYIRTKKIPENISLDESPTKDLTFYEGHPLPPVYVQTGLSCQLNCAFCRYPILSGDPCYMSLDALKENFDYIKSLGVSSIIFVDDSLNIPLDRFKKMLRMMIKEKYNFKWYSFFRISHSDDETYDLMKESGCKGVILGVESGCNTILKNMDKQVSSEKLEWGINELNKRGIITHASCMIGFPGETKETAQQTIEFIKRAKPTFYDIQTWYYEKSVPISKEKDYYMLEGYGYNWKHKDMDSQTAGSIVIDAINEINESCFMPSLSFNLWSLGYYLTQGVELHEVKEFCHLFKELIGEQTVNETYNRTLNQLLNVFKMNRSLYNNLNSRKKMNKVIIVNEIYDYFSLNLAFAIFEKYPSYILKFNRIFYSKIINDDKYKNFIMNSLFVVFDLTEIFVDSEINYEMIIIKSQENLPKSKSSNYKNNMTKEINWINDLHNKNKLNINIIDTELNNNSKIKLYKEILLNNNVRIDKYIVIPFVYNQYESSMQRTIFDRINTSFYVFKEWIISRVPNFFEENEILLYIPKKNIIFIDCNLFDLILQIKSVYLNENNIQIIDKKEYDYIDTVNQLAKKYDINLSITLDRTRISKIDSFLYDTINFYAYSIFYSKILFDKYLHKEFYSENNIKYPLLQETDYIEENTVIFDKNGNEINFYDIGKGELIIIVNAFGVEINAWSKVINELKKNYRIIVWKIRGLRDKELERINKTVYDLDEQVKDIERIFKYSKEKRVHIVSWCSGVKSAALFCQKYKDNILSFSCLGGEFAPFKGSEPYHSKFRKNVNLICHLIDEDKRMLHFYKKIINQGVFNKPLDNYSVDKVEYIYEIIPEKFKNLLLSPFLVDETMINFLNMCRDYYKIDLTEVLKYLDFPILFLTADCDQVSPYQQSLWASNITKYSYYIKFPCSSHYFILERPKEVVEALYFIFNQNKNERKTKL